MWYCVETAFVDGQHFKSIVVYDPADKRRFPAGTCLAEWDEEPHNTCEKFLNGLIEIHTDWFQTLEQAKMFASGAGTYISHYNARWYDRSRSWINSFVKWEFVSLEGREPWRGIYDINKIGGPDK